MPQLHKDESFLTSTKKLKKSKEKNKKSKDLTDSQEVTSSVKTENLELTKSEEFNETNQQQEHQIETKPEEPKSQFEIIWSTDNLMPKLDEKNAQLTATGEEFAPNLKRAKSILGGRVFKSDEESRQISLTNLDIKKPMIVKPLELKSDDSAILLLNSASSSSSISNRFL